MSENLLSQSTEQPSPNPVSHLRQEYDAQQALFAVQPALVQRFLEAQARLLADAIMQHASQVRFGLPDRVVVKSGDEPVTVPSGQREQVIGRIIDRLTGANLQASVRQRLMEWESSPDEVLATSAKLLRHVVVLHMVRNMLPAGRSVTYTTADGDEIPSIPVSTGDEKGSAITATTDAIAEEGADESGRGELLVPYVEAARRFYLPQWVAFDDEDHLLVNSVSEAKAHVQSMQRFLSVLHAAVYLAPYMVADDEYQQKRYGMLGQLTNQGRALARYQTQEIITRIKQRAAAQELNRGLSLSLPFFDDQDIEMKSRDFQIIPGGRIMFVPAFVVRAAREEQAKVAQDTRLNHSTRKHLLAGLKMLEDAFVS